MLARLQDASTLRLFLKSRFPFVSSRFFRRLLSRQQICYAVHCELSGMSPKQKVHHLVPCFSLEALSSYS
jgi:hypothetical protein